MRIEALGQASPELRTAVDAVPSALERVATEESAPFPPSSKPADT
jgi:hypothetical protein